MKSLFPIGVTVSLGVILSTNMSVVDAANVRSPRQAARSTVSIEREFTELKGNIKYVAQNLSLAGTKSRVKPVLPLQVPPSTPVVEMQRLFASNTPYLIFVSTEAKKWRGLQQFHLYSLAEKAIAQFAPQGVSFDYQRDVESWLGKQVVFGFLPKRQGSLATLESSYIGVIPVRDQSRAEMFLGFLETDQTRVKTRDYKGIKIYEVTTPNLSTPPKPKPVPKALPEQTLTTILGGQSRTIAVASLPGYMVTGLSGSAIEQVIDNYQGNGNHLGNNQDFQEFWRRSQSEEVLISLYQNPRETMVLYQDILKDPNLGMGQVELPQFIQDLLNPDKYKGYRYSQGLFKLQPEGVRIQFAIHNHPDAANKQLKDAKPVPVVGRMPGATYTSFSSSNLSLQWQGIVNLFGGIKEFQDGLNSFREFFRTSTGLDFDKDILGWIDGEYGLFLYPTKGGFLNTILPNFNAGFGFVVETQQPEVAKNTLNKLETLLKSVSGGALKVANRSIQGQPVTSWELEANQSLFAYSWLNPNTIMMGSGAGAIAELVPNPRSPLNTAYNFTTATNSLPKPNKGYFYMNMGSLLSWIYGFVPAEFHANQDFRTFKEAIGSVYSLSTTASQIPNGEQFDSLIVLAPNRSRSGN
ncbi:DUF3352 domain-containing protein [Calothrix sp. NIES-3974]|uniref:DUF3352 domain-containing protein n=1 Tax=Calothrix sp. NIES-3974 TaxID=2005462 RepID=UPI000B5FF710|nr:DUF3352 domain-containing protein [Calothrix sp. NIES-3974]BAZ06307.1 hypothetical protein NIES3974_29650 [Calothrix sp. NIES-3974]